jgi:hypothetical protein
MSSVDGKIKDNLVSNGTKDEESTPLYSLVSDSLREVNFGSENGILEDRPGNRRLRIPSSVL